MTFIVFSDSHGRKEAMCGALDRVGAVDYMIFLGDGLAEAEQVSAEHPRITPLFVRGNCDSPVRFGDTPEELTLDLAGVRLFLHHGHTTHVKFGTATLEHTAQRKDVDLALFGHTHTPLDRYVSQDGAGGRSFRLFNPGSIKSGSFGIIHVTAAGIMTNHMEVTP